MEELAYFGSVPVDYHVIADHYNHLSARKDKISDLVKNGALVRLKKGKYLISKNLKEHPPSLELIANHLYGPSYVSFETALSYYGWIPERTYLVKSAITKRKKTFTNPLGNFEYITVPKAYYPIGIRQIISDQHYAFLMASPEKAVCDLLMTTKGLRIQSFKSMKTYLAEDLRLDPDPNHSIDLQVFEEAEKSGHKKTEMALLHKYFKEFILTK
jgi:hypothetical protein